MEQTHLDAGEWHRHENTQMHRNAIIHAGLITSSHAVATLLQNRNTSEEKKMMSTYKKEKNNAEADVPGILITVISTPTQSRFED